MTKKEKDYALIVKIQNGDNDAFNELYDENQGLIHMIVKKYHQNNKFDYEDLFQIGSLAFCRSIQNFDISMGFALSTFTSLYIEYDIRTHIRNFNGVKISRNGVDTIWQIQKLVRNNSNITDDTICNTLNICKTDLSELRNAKNITSLNERVKHGNTDPNICVFDTISDGFKLEDTVINKIQLEKVLDTLTDKEKKIIKMYFYQNLTQKQIAKSVITSQANVSRAIKIALLKLRKELVRTYNE